MEFNQTLAVYTTNSRKVKVYQAAPQSLQELFKRCLLYTSDAADER